MAQFPEALVNHHEVFGPQETSFLAEAQAIGWNIR
jgi:hypothetical protein